MKYKEAVFIGNKEGVIDIPDDVIIISSTFRDGMDIGESFRLVVTALVPVKEGD